MRRRVSREIMIYREKREERGDIYNEGDGEMRYRDIIKRKE